MGFPAGFGQGYDLEDGFKWDAITFDLAHATGASISNKLNVNLGRAANYSTKFSVTNKMKEVMFVTICNITAEDRGKVEKIAPGKTRHIIRRIPRRAVMYYRFEDK
ncbi:hypothetical protein IPM19_03440 [bacterium]|nr:MAG: hypothetical protein IPM19_03440 [bacterium]